MKRVLKRFRKMKMVCRMVFVEFVLRKGKIQAIHLRPRAINLISSYQEIKMVGNYQTHLLTHPSILISQKISFETSKIRRKLLTPRSAQKTTQMAL